MSNPSRTILSISGADARKFLQDLISNDMAAADAGLTYAAILTPQGKYLFDFFVTNHGDAYLIDVATSQAAALARRLTMYRLRAAVEIEASDLIVSRGIGDAPDGALDDPRHTALGWRFYGDERLGDDIDWDAIRVAHVIPETDIELITDETYILEAGFERLSGVDFRKGCYVGQEVTARMKHKTELRKGLAQVAIHGGVPVGSEITKDGKSVGRIFTQSGGQAIAYLRFDRAGDGMECEGIAVIYLRPDPQPS